jgi:hypothetical protein
MQMNLVCNISQPFGAGEHRRALRGGTYPQGRTLANNGTGANGSQVGRSRRRSPPTPGAPKSGLALGRFGKREEQTCEIARLVL